MNLDSLKASGPDCIPVVVLKNCELELSYILAENYHPVSLLSVVSKVFEKILGLLITLKNVAFFLISSMILYLLDQLQIF